MRRVEDLGKIRHKFTKLYLIFGDKFKKVKFFLHQDLKFLEKCCIYYKRREARKGYKGDPSRLPPTTPPEDPPSWPGRVLSSFGFREVLGKLLWVGCGFLLFLISFSFVAPRLGWHIDAVLSGSMSPSIRTGDLVITRPLPAEEIKAGDIITFFSPLDGKPVTHRVVRLIVREEGGERGIFFRTKGDANEDEDPFIVPSCNVIGKVVFHLPLLGYFLMFLKSRIGFLLLIAIPGAVIIATEMRNLWRYLSEEEELGRAP